MKTYIVYEHISPSGKRYIGITSNSPNRRWGANGQGYIKQKTKDTRYWKELVRWLPESWLQTRTWTANYETILSICHQRRSHKLNEWSGIHTQVEDSFIQWARTLPYAQEFLFFDETTEQVL